MGDLNAEAQIVKVTMEELNFFFKVSGKLGAEAMKALFKLIKFLGYDIAYKNHKENKIENIKGEVDFKNFKKKYKGDDISIVELSEGDAKKFIDMCEKTGIAVTRLPDLNCEDGKVQFFVSNSTMPNIKFIFEKLNQYHMERGEDVEPGKEITAMDYVRSSLGETDEEKVKNFCNEVEKMSSKYEDISKEQIEDLKKNIGLGNEKEVKEFMTNVSDTSRKALLEENGYEKVEVSQKQFIKESSNTITFVDSEGKKMEADKHLAIKENGKVFIYCPKDENGGCGKIISEGKKLTKDDISKRLSQGDSNKSNQTKDAKKSAKATKKAEPLKK